MRTATAGIALRRHSSRRSVPLCDCELIHYCRSVCAPRSQPLYCGSNLVLSMEMDLSEILHYDPCFDYVGAGLITVVPTQPADADADAEADAEAETGDGGQTQGDEGMYDLVMAQGATFDAAQ